MVHRFAARAAALIVPLALLAPACSDHAPLAPGRDGGGQAGSGGDGGAHDAPAADLPGETPRATFTDSFPADRPEVDLLFVVDNSLGMTPLQRKLIANFPRFIQVLQGLPGGLPSIHIGVVSSDLGAGAAPDGSVVGCHAGGDRGVLHNEPRGLCTSTGLLGGARFIADADGVKNYDPTMPIDDVFACLALLGDGGCGFEHHLASAARALGADGHPPPPENAGFLRPNAVLQLFVLADEDDCSAPADSGLFAPGTGSVGSPLGPLTSFRCNEYGHLCGGAPPPRTRAADLGSSCAPAENQHTAPAGVPTLTDVADLYDGLLALKGGDRSKVLVSVIGGPPSSYQIEQIAGAGPYGNERWPQVKPSCTAADGTFAQPAVRLKAMADAAGGNGVFLPICADSFAPALQRVAEQVGRISQRCLSGTPDDRDPATPGVQPRCTATVAHAGTVEPLRLCDPQTNVAGVPCLSVLEDEATCGPGGWLAAFAPNGVTFGAGVTVGVDCQRP